MFEQNRTFGVMKQTKPIYHSVLLRKSQDVHSVVYADKQKANVMVLKSILLIFTMSLFRSYGVHLDRVDYIYPRTQMFA